MYVLGYSGFPRDSRLSPGYRNPFAKTKQDFDSIFDFREGEVPFQMFPLGFFGHDAAAALIKDGKIVLDFNLSYNPYCAYSAEYSCPLPPAENYLATAIPAGEKNYE